jgi:hypothetical protein
MTDHLEAPIAVTSRLRALHHMVPRWRCGARATETIEHGDRRHPRPITVNLICTSDPGHDGLHKDALHCWTFHRFEASVPDEPEDVWHGDACSCGRLNCETRAILDEAGIPDHPDNTGGTQKENA